MSDLPTRPPAPAPPLPPAWTEHKAPSGHTYYYNKETKKSTYNRPLPEAPQHFEPPPLASQPPFQQPNTAPAAYNPASAQDVFNPQRQMEDLIFASAPKHFPAQAKPGQSSRGGRQNNFLPRRREQDDRPKHRQDIPNCAPWILVRTRFGRRFVWNKSTNESFWRFPPHVMRAVVELDQRERDRKEGIERGEPSLAEEQDEAMAEIEAELAEAEEEIEIVEVDGDEGMENDEEYEEVEVTDDEGEESGTAPKRQRTEEPSGEQLPGEGDGAEDDDLAWQLAQMEEMENMQDEEGYDEEYYEDEGPELTEEDCKALFKELLDDKRTSPYAPWDKVIEDGLLYDDGRYKALPNMAARKECFKDWSRERAQTLKEEKAKQVKRDPKIPYLALLDRHATPKLYWREFQRKYRKEPEIKDTKLSDKDKEKLYRDHIKRLALGSSTQKSDLSALLKAQPLALLNRSTTIDTLPDSVLIDLRHISLPPLSRNSLIETYISTLPPAPSGATYSAEEEANREKKRAERERREKALEDRERRVREEKRRQERDLAYGKARLREEEEEIQRAMNIGKEGLKAHLKE